MFIDMEDHMIRPLVARRREKRCKIKYLELVQYTQAVGDTLRAKNGSKALRPEQVLYLEEGTRSASLQHDSARGGYD